MAITLTERAAKQICNQLDQQGKGLALKIGLKQSGCSGFGYTFDYVDKIEESDELFITHNAKVLIPKENLSYFDGAELDFVKEGLNSSFRFNNPNIENACGCGESFGLKISEEN
ncbi:MAG: iron-sulfur cluster assembly accessory protein [Nitrosomonas sp.]|nr:MAG: iron-sulfur cluster assembly accessory protein [Nitrosomonas sp.]